MERGGGGAKLTIHRLHQISFLFSIKRAKKVVSSSPRPVALAIGLVIFVLNDMK